MPNRRNLNSRLAIGYTILALLVLAVYSNHFGNGFHFDDSHVVVGNPYIRDIRNIPRFFADVKMDSILPADQNYRPFVLVSLTIDYWLGHGLNPFWFQLSTFCWFLIQLGLMVLLFRCILDRARPDPRNQWVALFGAAVYGLHTAMAETVNYVMQRGEVFSTTAVISGLLVYIAIPGWRRYGIYLIFPALGVLAKEPSAVFPALLFMWIWLFEERDLRKAALRCLPAALVVGAAALLVLAMQSATFTPGGASPYAYRISQPAVLMSYFRRFFLPVDLSADTDRAPYTSLLQPDALLGFVFVACVIAAILWCRKRREYCPVAFGLAWFLIVCLPTSWIALAEVENDHRLYFPFVGLALSCSWAAWLWVDRRRVPRSLYLPACGLALAALAWGAHQRNAVWNSDEELWRDVTVKSPKNGRGLMNYGLTQMANGNYPVALDYFQRAAVLAPNYPTLEINLGIVNGALNRAAEAESHFNRAVALAPGDSNAYYFYARWLSQVGRRPEAIVNLKIAVEKNGAFLDARYLLMELYAAQNDAADLRALAAETLSQFPADTAAANWLRRAGSLKPGEAVVQATPESYLNQSLSLFQAGKYAESIAAAREALKLRPDYAEAWNNIMAGYNSLSEWDNAIAAGEQALRLNPNFERARNNLTWAKSHKNAAR